MFNSVRKARSGEAGFTLVELLVVIVILGILAAIVVFAVGGISNKGDDAANKTDCSVLQAAEEAYFGNQTSSPAYTADQQVLVDAGFLHAKSTKHPTIVLGTTAGGAPTYTITGCP